MSWIILPVFVLFSIISGIMHVAVVTTADPQDMASSRQVGTGLIVDVFKKICAVLYSSANSLTEAAGLDNPSVFPTSLVSKFSVIRCQPL